MSLFDLIKYNLPETARDVSDSDIPIEILRAWWTEDISPFLRKPNDFDSTYINTKAGIGF